MAKENITFKYGEIGDMLHAINSNWDSLKEILSKYSEASYAIPESWISSASIGFSDSYSTAIIDNIQPLLDSYDSFYSNSWRICGRYMMHENLMKKELDQLSSDEVKQVNVLKNFGGPYCDVIFGTINGEQYMWYTTVSGDTFFNIATNMNVSMEDLKNANPEITDPSKIGIGVTIKCPLSLSSSGGDE